MKGRDEGGRETKGGEEWREKREGRGGSGKVERGERGREKEMGRKGIRKGKARRRELRGQNSTPDIPKGTPTPLKISLKGVDFQGHKFGGQTGRKLPMTRTGSEGNGWGGVGGLMGVWGNEVNGYGS